MLNGTSSSNKIVLTTLIAEGDLVLLDHNTHKAAHHGALLKGGGIPVFLETDRNPQGLIGPIDIEALDKVRIREQIRDHPLVTDAEAWQRPRPFRVFESGANLFPGFDNEIQGLFRQREPDGSVRFYTYVVREP